MANKDAAFGLRPARMMNGSAFMNQQMPLLHRFWCLQQQFSRETRLKGLTAGGTIGVKAARRNLFYAALGVFNFLAAVTLLSPKGFLKKKAFSNYTLASTIAASRH